MKRVASTEKLQILSHSMRHEEDSVEVEGVAKNVSSSTLKFAEIEINFYDAKGKFFTQTADQVWDLGAGETWHFRGGTWEYDESGKPTKVKSYKVKVWKVATSE